MAVKLKAKGKVKVRKTKRGKVLDIDNLTFSVSRGKRKGGLPIYKPRKLRF